VSQHPEVIQSLADLQAGHDFFVGLDSDGTVFDTMEIKHKDCVIPNIIQYWNLQPIAGYVRETAAFVNLYSQWRGIDRWTGLITVCDLLRSRAEVQAVSVRIPRLTALHDFIRSEFPPSTEGLRQFMAGRADPELETAWEWSRAVNATARERFRDIPNFPGVREALANLAGQADLAVVSGNPLEGLHRQWREAGLTEFITAIAGQEMGRKTDQLRSATHGKYPKNHVLMIGDSPADLQAAVANGLLFYPVIPGREARSWERFSAEAMERFFGGAYAGPYETGLIEEFEAQLPTTPPWEKTVTPKITETTEKKLTGTTDYTACPEQSGN